jgi:beta-galactosidase
MKRILIVIAAFLFCFSFFCNAQDARTTVDLSKNNWKLWLDTAAKWQNDRLYAPPVDVTKLPLNLPTGGWAALQRTIGKLVHLPATVEEYYWGANGNPFGVSGNYLGVSWFTTSFNIPTTAKGKRIALQFAAVRFRAEIFINKHFAAYDLVNSTPFEIDISKYVNYGGQNEVAVRITDPNGNFDWRDSQNFMWGDYRTNPTHGFGGITGKVKLLTTSPVFVSDVFIKNKPTPNQIDLQVTTSNITGKAQASSFVLQVTEAKQNGKIVYERTYDNIDIPAGEKTNTFSLAVKDAKLWSLDAPNLYRLTVKLRQNRATIDNYDQRFGFRWFEVRDVSGDKQFYLNGKRVVLITSISWGFWPVNGIAPSDELARKQVMDAKRLGLTMLNFHRTIGQQNVLDYADELGLLYFEEPGGNQYPAERFNAADAESKMQADFYFATRNEKLFRMIRRDRNHPSLVIYNMHNERGAEPQQQDRDEMMAAHKLDETRIITYNSSNGPIKQGPDPRFKLHMMPYDFTFYDYGWFDQHHAGGPGTYHDNLYNNPKDYAKYTDKKDEIIYYGEEGAIGTPPRLQLIHDQILKDGKNIGWETDDYLKWYDAYNSFLQSHPGFKKVYPNVDSLTKSMGNVAYYYQGRVIENVKINNTIDGYAINGWESMKLENHSGIVDNYRNLKGDPSLISRYTQPLYLAVKMNRKVLSVNDTSIVDLYIVNEKDLHGPCSLVVKAIDEDGHMSLNKSYPVTVQGGSVYGQLLHAGVLVAAIKPGYTTITAELLMDGRILTRGNDKIYAVQPDASGIPSFGMVADTSGVLAPFLKSKGIQLKEYRSGRPEGKYLLVGAFQPQQTGNQLVTDILEWVNDGNTLIIVNNSEEWAAHLAQKEVIDYRGSKLMGTTWYGGNFFSKQHPLFNGLPQAQVFNWEYQCFATYNKSRIGLRIFNGETIVACVADHKKEVYSALSIIPHGRGKIILCSLDIFSCLKDLGTSRKVEGEGENAAMNTFNASSKNKANVVGQQLLLNMLKYANR